MNLHGVVLVFDDLPKGLENGINNDVRNPIGGLGM